MLAARQREAEKQAQEGTSAQEAKKEEDIETTDVLGEQEDNDVIF
jgi:hypothetical protein